MLLVMVFVYVFLNLMAFVTVIVGVKGIDKYLDNLCDKGAESLGISPTLYFAIYLLACCLIFIPAMIFTNLKQ